MLDTLAGCNNIIENNGLAPDGDLGCNMPCTGNSAETFGGANRLDLYQYA